MGRTWNHLKNSGDMKSPGDILDSASSKLKDKNWQQQQQQQQLQQQQQQQWQNSLDMPTKESGSEQ
ncbi:unnamed protein product, partial [Allacma fusca]